jgi:hypothetical protein
MAIRIFCRKVRNRQFNVGTSSIFEVDLFPQLICINWQRASTPLQHTTVLPAGTAAAAAQCRVSSFEWRQLVVVWSSCGNRHEGVTKSVVSPVAVSVSPVRGQLGSHRCTNCPIGAVSIPAPGLRGKQCSLTWGHFGGHFSNLSSFRLTEQFRSVSTVIGRC